MATLHEAADTGRLAELEALLGRRADPNEVDRDGWAPLTMAAKSGHDAVVRALVAAGAATNPAVHRHTALRGAAIYGHLDICSLLLDLRADPDLASDGARTALMGAAMNGHADVVRLLRRRGATLDLRNDFGEDALMLALKFGHHNCAAALSDDT